MSSALKRAITVYETIGSKYSVALAPLKYGQLCVELGDPERAIANFEAARDIWTSVGMLNYAAIAEQERIRTEGRSRAHK